MVVPKNDFAEQAAQYLEKNEVYDILQDLLQKVIVARPADPIEFLCECLQAKAAIKICVIGPPGCDRKEYSKKLATEYQVEHIVVGEMLGTPDATGALTSDDAVVAAVNKRLTALSPSAGFVLDGYPRTKVQATALQQFLPDKVILLNASETAIKQRYAEKGAADRDTINRRLQHHYRHVAGVAEVFKNSIGQLDVRSEDRNAVFEQLKKLINLRPYSNAPKRPPRICIVGPPGIGKTVQAKITASDLGCVRIDAHALLNEHGSPASDENICTIVGDRLQQIDCVRRGWVLDGFPNTIQQSKFLKKAYWPTRVVQMIGSDTLCLKRLSTRRIDPSTGVFYFDEPSDASVRQRLVQADMDKPERVRERYERHCAAIPEIMKDYAEISQEVRGDLEMAKVSEAIDNYVRRPLASERAI